MGLAIGVAGYALLRRLGLPGWGATIAMVPVLLSAYAIQIEHFLLSDTLFALLVMIAIVLMMWWPDPPVWACGLAGLLLAAAVLARSEGVRLRQDQAAAGRTAAVPERAGERASLPGDLHLEQNFPD